MAGFPLRFSRFLAGFWPVFESCLAAPPRHPPPRRRPPLLSPCFGRSPLPVAEDAEDYPARPGLRSPVSPVSRLLSQRLVVQRGARPVHQGQGGGQAQARRELQGAHRGHHQGDLPAGEESGGDAGGKEQRMPEKRGHCTPTIFQKAGKKKGLCFGVCARHEPPKHTATRPTRRSVRLHISFSSPFGNYASSKPSRSVKHLSSRLSSPNDIALACSR